MPKKYKRASAKSIRQNKKGTPEKNSRPKMKIAPWVIASIVILFIAVAAYKEYISNLVSQILLVATVVIFAGYRKYLKDKG